MKNFFKLKENSEKKILAFFALFHIYCLVLAFLNGNEKLRLPWIYFSNFLIWWCTWNSLLTLFFAIWKKKSKPDTNKYIYNLFFFIVTLSNFVTLVIYGLGFFVWIFSSLICAFGIISRSYKIVPIPSHSIENFNQFIKVIHWWSYSPLWHIILPIFFMKYFYDFSKINLLLKKKASLFLASLIHPILYYLFILFRAKISPEDHLRNPFMKWPFALFSAKKISSFLNISKGVWKIIFIFSWILFFFFGIKIIFYFRIKKNSNKNR